MARSKRAVEVEDGRLRSGRDCLKHEVVSKPQEGYCDERVREHQKILPSPKRRLRAAGLHCRNSNSFPQVDGAENADPAKRCELLTSAVREAEDRGDCCRCRPENGNERRKLARHGGLSEVCSDYNARGNHDNRCTVIESCFEGPESFLGQFKLRESFLRFSSSTLTHLASETTAGGPEQPQDHLDTNFCVVT